MGHAERLDSLNTRSYHGAVLELTNRREKLLGIRRREASTQREEVLEYVANTGMVAAPCPSGGTKGEGGKEAEGDEYGGSGRETAAETS